MYVQFYGVNNVERWAAFESLDGAYKMDNVYQQGTYWTLENMNADTSMPRWLSTPNGSYFQCTRYHYDASYIRLKNIELGYTFTDGWVKRIGLSDFKVYLSGNNLWVWTRMPDDRESNFAGTGLATQGAYPTMKRISLGIRFHL